LVLVVHGCASVTTRMKPKPFAQTRDAGEDIGIVVRPNESTYMPKGNLFGGGWYRLSDWLVRMLRVLGLWEFRVLFETILRQTY